MPIENFKILHKVKQREKVWLTMLLIIALELRITKRK